MNKKLIKIKSFCFLLLMVFSIFCLNGSGNNNRSIFAAGEKVVFSEVLYDSRINYDTQGEWIELYNPQSRTIDISKWTIQDNTAVIKIPSGTTIGPKTYLIIADGTAFFSNLYGCIPGVSYDSLKLSNTGDYLILRNSSGIVIDQVAWGSGGKSINGWGSTSKPTASEGKTIRRADPNHDTDTYRDWISSSSPQPDCGDNGGGGNQGNDPFGSFETPLNNSTVSGSIPVTGWALDDIGVQSVKIFGKDTKNSFYIGDAVFVEGARPDIAIAYPDYPNNQKAGWGYMLLTNFLPDNGNGTFTLEARITDTSGNLVVLGNKTIHCDNANAVKPFGAIDSPAQGGSASGNTYMNNGWVLTPQPNHIPVDGKTIEVWVDSVKKGHPVYNLFRSDIASLLPGYANSNGAAGSFSFDTTGYSNGVHTIHWIAADSAGNSSGIGSRYFTIQNSSHDLYRIVEISSNPSTVEIPSCEPIQVHRGFHHERDSQWLTPGENGIFSISIEELEPLEIQLDPLFSGAYGFTKQGETLKPLPVGSTFDRKNAIFYWIPGPGFPGIYELVFIETCPFQAMKKIVEITILPCRENF